VAPNKQENTRFAVGSGMRIMNWVQVSLCIYVASAPLNNLLLPF
jgi:hypothetical protein